MDVFRLLAMAPIIVSCHLVVGYEPGAPDASDAALIADAPGDALIDTPGDTASVDDASGDTLIDGPYDGTSVEGPATDVRFCTMRPNAVLCDDFDDLNPTLAKWDADSHDWLIDVDDPVANSPPHAAHIVVPVNAKWQDPACRYGRFNKKHQTSSKTTVRLEWAFWLGDKDTDPGFVSGSIMQLLASGGTMNAVLCGLFLVVSLEGEWGIKEQDRIEEEDKPEDLAWHPIEELLQSGRYYQAELEMTLEPSPTFTFHLDGKLLVNEPMNNSCVGVPAEFETNIGFHCLPKRTIAHEIRLDDIAVSFFP